MGIRTLGFVKNDLSATSDLESMQPRGIPVSNARKAAALKRENKQIQEELKRINASLNNFILKEQGT